MKDEFDKLQKYRWDFKYGLFTTHIIEMNPNELLNKVSVGYSDAAKPPVRRNGNHLSDGRKPQLLLVRRSRLSGVWHEPLVRTNVSHR